MRERILIPESETLFTPKEFSEIQTSERARIDTVRVSPPRFGRRGFGTIVVKWRHPQLRPKAIMARVRAKTR